MDKLYDAVVIGGGPAGLATSRELARAGVNHLVLERGDQIGHTWANLYDGLVLHTGKHLSALPGMPFPASTPLFPARRDFLAYLQTYADTFKLPVRTGADVAAVERDGDAWMIRTTEGGEMRARAVVMATGIVANPQMPDIPGRDCFRGRVMHSVEYRRPEGFHRVLVVGAGNSAGEISVEIANAGAHVTIAVRSGARAVPLQLFGIPIQYFAVALSGLPRAAFRRVIAATGRVSELFRGPAVLPPPDDKFCSNVPLIGLHLSDAIRDGSIRLKRGIESFTADGVRFDDGSEEPFDEVILATGYKAAVGSLGTLIRLDECGFAARRRRVVSADQPGLYFVGHNYDVRGGLRNIAQDARLAAREVRRAVRS